MSTTHIRSNEINKLIITIVNKLYNTSYKEVNDEVFNKFFNSDIYDITLDDRTKKDNDINIHCIYKWSYEANQYLLKNIVDGFIKFKFVNSASCLSYYTEFYTKYRFSPISIKNFNYIVNKIVEWTISDSSFKDFVKDAKKDKKFNNNILQFVITTLDYALYHKRYILYIIYKYAEVMNYETIIYLFETNILWNNSDFDKYYKELINKKFNEELFKISDEDNYNDCLIPEDFNKYSIRKYNKKFFDNDHYVLNTLLYLLEHNDFDNIKEPNIRNPYYVDEVFLKSASSIFDPYIVLFNYLVLSNRINDLKTLLLTKNSNNMLYDGLKINNYSLSSLYIDKEKYKYNFKFSSILFFIRNDLYLRFFVTVEIYRMLLYLDISNEIMEILVNPFYSININVHNNYYDNNDIENIPKYEDEDKKELQKIRHDELSKLLDYINNDYTTKVFE